MPAYFIVDNEVTDPAGFEEYRTQVPGTVEKYGGKFLVRGGQTEYLEGDWRPKRIVVVEFESLDKARAFHQSPEYAEAMKIRQRTSVSSVLIVQGA